MPSRDYHLEQAQLAISMALAETDETKLSRLRLLALEHFERAEKAGAEAEASRPSRTNLFEGTSPHSP